jgi:hypothetical protein
MRVEFKFVALGDADLSGEAARSLAGKALRTVPAMAAETKKAREQTRRDGDSLDRPAGRSTTKNIKISFIHDVFSGGNWGIGR